MLLLTLRGYASRVSPRIQSCFIKLSKQDQAHFYARLDLFRNDSRHPLLNRHVLRGKWAGCFSISVTGDLRSIVDLDIANDKAKFLRIGTHHQLYGK